MKDETNAEVSEVGSAPSTEPSQSADTNAQEAAPEKSAVEVQAQAEEPAKEAASTTEPAAEAPAKEEDSSSLTLVERIEKIEQAHAAFVKKLDEQYAIR